MSGEIRGAKRPSPPKAMVTLAQTTLTSLSSGVAILRRAARRPASAAGPGARGAKMLGPPNRMPGKFQALPIRQQLPPGIFPWDQGTTRRPASGRVSQQWDSVPGHHVFNKLQTFQNPVSFRFIPKLWSVRVRFLDESLGWDVPVVCSRFRLPCEIGGL